MVHEGRVRVTDATTRLLADRLLAANLADPELAGPVAAELLTVVIPVRDRAAQLGRALAALGPDLACIVVDDDSHDPDAVAEVASAHGARLLRLAVNVGPAGARNAGLREVRTPYVAFVDSDITVAADVLRRLARHLDDPGVALVGPRVVSRARSRHPAWFERYDEHASSLELGRVGCSVRPGAAVAWLPSACLVGRVAQLGDGFSADMRVGEDVDLVWRLVASGLGVRYDPSFTAQHDTRATVGAWLGRKFVYGSGGADLAARHGDNVAPAVLSPAFALAAAALLGRSRWAPALAVVGLARGAWRVRRATPEIPRRNVLAARLAVRGLGWSVRQESALLLRHWWPAALVGALVSRRVRRMVVTALVVDQLVATSEASGLSPPVLFAGRRLDDAAYGAGLWWGAARARSAAVLAVRWIR